MDESFSEPQLAALEKLFGGVHKRLEEMVHQDRVNELWALHAARAARDMSRTLATMIGALQRLLEAKGVLTGEEFASALAEHSAGIEVEIALSSNPAFADPDMLNARIAELEKLLGFGGPRTT